MLSITEISNKINQNKKVTFSATILCIIVIFFISSAYSVLVDVPRVIQTEQPFHLVYVDFNNHDNSKKIDELINRENNKLVAHKTMEFLYGRRIIRFGDIENSLELAVISDTNYNSISGENINLRTGETMGITSDLGGKKSEQFPYDKIKLEFGNRSYDFSFLGEERTIPINLGVQPSRFMLMIDSEEFQKIKNDIDASYSGTFHMFNFDDWRSMGPMVSQLKKVLEDMDKKNYDSQGINGTITSNPFKTGSRIEYYHFIKQESSMRLFVVGFMGILFLICMGCVIYFKMITDMEQVKNKYNTLLRVGITNNEFKKVISNELKVIFFTPILLGSFLGYMLIRIATLNSRMEETFSINTLIVIVSFFLFQLLYYLITLRKYYKDIII